MRYSLNFMLLQGLRKYPDFRHHLRFAFSFLMTVTLENVRLCCRSTIAHALLGLLYPYSHNSTYTNPIAAKITNYPVIKGLYN
jgi:hypothetical protein